MPVKYNGSGLIPAPLLSINKSVIRGTGDTITGQDYTITLNGTIVNTDGTGNNNLDSPGASGSSDTRMRGVQGGINFIRSLFAQDGGLLEVYSPESQVNKLSCYCKVDSVNFDQGVWVQKCAYTVVLKTKYIDGNDLLNQLDDIQESWDIQELENGNATVSHKIQAKGRLLKINGTYNSPLSIAKQWVNSRAYNIVSNQLSEQVVGSGVMVPEIYQNAQVNIDDSYFYNRMRTDYTSPIDYTYSVTETFLRTLYQYQDEFSVSVNLEQDWPHRATININGVITGLSTHGYDNDARLANASGYYFALVEPNLYTRANLYKPRGYTVNPVFLSKQISYDITPGNMKYGITYAALNGTPLVSGAIDESIQISDIGKTDIVAIIPVPGRSSGPVIQYMAAKTAPERQVSISATIGNSGNITITNLYNSYLNKPNTDAIINALKPTNTSYYYIKQDSEDYNPLKGAYSRTVSWVIDVPSGVAMPLGIPQSSGNYYTG